MNKYKNNKAFTLIELLVVISIIGLLSSVVLSSLNTARAKARDAQRLTMINQLQKAISLYYFDNNGSYPGTAGVHYGNNDISICNTTLFGSDKPLLDSAFDSDFKSKYLSTLPVDPSNYCISYIRFNPATPTTIWQCFNGSTPFQPDGYLFSTPSPPVYSYLITAQFETNAGNNFPSHQSAGSMRKCFLGPEL